MNIETVKELIANLPKCEYYQDRNKDRLDVGRECPEPATWLWQPGWYGEARVNSHHVECDKHSSQYGRDWNAAVSEGRVKQLPYASALRKLLKSKVFRTKNKLQ